MELTTTFTDIPQAFDLDLSEFDAEISLSSISAVPSLDLSQQEENGIFAILQSLMCSPLILWLDPNEISLYLKNQLPWHVDNQTLNLRPLWIYLREKPGIQEEALRVFFQELSRQKLPWSLLLPWNETGSPVDTHIELPEVPSIEEPTSSVFSYEVDSLLIRSGEFSQSYELDALLLQSGDFPIPGYSDHATSSSAPFSGTIRPSADPIEQGIDTLLGVIDTSPVALWVNRDSFQQYLTRRIPEYIRAHILDLEPIYDNLSRVPGIPSGVLEIVFSELTRQNMPWKLCLPRHLEALSWLQTSNVISRRTYEALATSQSELPEISAASQTSTYSKSTTSPNRTNIKGLAHAAQNATGSSHASSVKDTRSHPPTTSSIPAGRSKNSVDESLHTDDLLADLPQDVLRQLEVLLADQSVAHFPLAQSSEHAVEPKIPAHTSQPIKKSSATPESPATLHLPTSSWRVLQFFALSRRGFLLLCLLIVLIFSLWLRAAVKHQVHHFSTIRNNHIHKDRHLAPEEPTPRTEPALKDAAAPTLEKKP